MFILCEFPLSDHAKLALTAAMHLLLQVLQLVEGKFSKVKKMR